MKKDDLLIVIAGNIGVGKTSFTRLISSVLDVEAIYENFAENPYLTRFYADMKKWSFQSQMFFLSERFKQADLLNSKKRLVCDRYIYEDAEIFAKNLFEEGVLAKEDWQLYQSFYNSIVLRLPKPSLLIYLKANTTVLKNRIKKRNREFETFSDQYLSDLNSRYDAWYAAYTRSPKLMIDTNTLDFVHNRNDTQKITTQTLEALRNHGLS